MMGKKLATAHRITISSLRLDDILPESTRSVDIVLRSKISSAAGGYRPRPPGRGYRFPYMGTSKNSKRINKLEFGEPQASGKSAPAGA